MEETEQTVNGSIKSIEYEKKIARKEHVPALPALFLHYSFTFTFRSVVRSLAGLWRALEEDPIYLIALFIVYIDRGAIDLLWIRCKNFRTVWSIWFVFLNYRILVWKTLNTFCGGEKTVTAASRLVDSTTFFRSCHSYIISMPHSSVCFEICETPFDANKNCEIIKTGIVGNAGAFTPKSQCGS